MPARKSALIGEHNVPPTSSEHNVPLILPSEGGDDLGDAELAGVLGGSSMCQTAPGAAAPCAWPPMEPIVLVLYPLSFDR